MKKLFLFLAMASTTMFVSCGSDDSDSTPVVPPVEGATAITVTASATAVEVGMPVTFTVKNNLTPAVDVTSSSTFTANGVAFNGPTFTPTAANVGTVTIVAKNGTLPTASVVITVTAAPVVANNSVVVANVPFTTNLSILYYLGTTADNINVFVANSYNQVGTGETATYPNDVYMYFTSAQISETTLDIPAVGVYDFGTDAEAMKTIDANIIVADDEILETGVATNATLNISAFTASQAASNWTYTYTATLANGSVVNGHYSGDWGFVNQSTARSGRGNSKVVTKVSNAQIKANLKAVMAKKVK